MNCSDNRKKRLNALERKEGRKMPVGGAGTQLRNPVKCGKHSEEFIIRCVLEG